MKTGIELIAKERQEQIKKHGRTIKSDVIFNRNFQLMDAAEILLCHDSCGYNSPEEDKDFPPMNWDINIWGKMVRKPTKERLIISGALIAAEIDRIQNDN